jgi:hypothetical protein
MGSMESGRSMDFLRRVHAVVLVIDGGWDSNLALDGFAGAHSHASRIIWIPSSPHNYGY